MRRKDRRHHRRLVPLALGLGLSLAFVASSSGSGASRSAEREPLVFEVVAKEVAETYVDLGDPDFSQADQFVFTNDLLRGKERVGSDGGVCTVTRLTAEGASTVYCSGSNALPGGQITVSGLIDYAPDEEFKQEPYSLAITGGTGKYRTARGEVRIKELSTTEFRITFRIILKGGNG
jgi:hypothetical protein